MAFYSTKDGDYGFLTGVQNTKLELKERVDPNLRHSLDNFNRKFSNQNNDMDFEANKCDGKEKTNKKQEKLTRKKSWWKSMFTFQKKRKNEDLQNSTLLRHKSDAGVLGKSILRQDRDRKYKSMLVDDSIIVYEGLDFDLTSSNSKINNQFNDQIQCNDEQHQGIPLAKRSASLDFLDRMKSGNTNTTLRRKNSNVTFTENASNNIHPNIENKHSTLSSSKVSSNSLRTTKNIPTKPPRQVKLNIDGKQKHSKHQKHVSLEDLLTNKTNSEEMKPIRRSMSMTLLRKPFRKKKKQISTNQNDYYNKSKTLSDKNNDKTFVDKSTGRVINVYEKYPRTKVEQKKVLVHINTREEIPVENGIPQWDAGSYQYASTSRYRLSQSNDELNPTSLETKPKQVYKESSFVGNYESQMPKKEVKNSDISKRTAEKLTDSKSKKNSHKDLDILLLDAEPTNRELHCGTKSIIKAMVHTDGNRSFSKSEAKDLITQSNDNSLNKTLSSESSNNTKNGTKVSASCEDVSFGRSFILTGVASDKVPDLISRKHSYLATSSPVRHMAQCLRQASISGKPLKISPNRTKLNMDQENKNETRMSENLNEINKIKSCSKQPTNAIAKKARDIENSHVTYPKRHVTFDKEYPPQHRRCYSDSDLSSSFSMSPMKLNNKYKSRNESSGQEHGKRLFRSRSARTDRLLYRMKTRLHRLEKLRDKSTNQLLFQDSKPKVTSIEQLSNKTNISTSNDQLPLAGSRTTLHDVRKSESEKFKKFRQWKEVQLPGTNSATTSLSKFKKLIDTRVAQYNKEIDGNFDKTKAILPSIPFYENIWPSNNNLKEDKVASIKSHVRTLDPKLEVHQNSNDKPLLIKTQNVSCALNTDTGKNIGNNQVNKVLHSPVEIKEVKFNLRKTSLGSSQNDFVTQINDTQNGRINEAVMEADDIFLSSTPVKNYAKYAQVALERKPSVNINTKPTTSNQNVSISPRFVTSHSTNSDSESLSPNPSLMPNASDFFLRSLLEQQEEIKQTMLSEMMKIRTKYNEVCTEVINAEEEAQTSFNDWKKEMRFHWDAGWHSDDERSSESDANSQKTLTRGSSAGASSSDETITNLCDADLEDGYATMSSNDSTVANYGSIVRPKELTPRQFITSKWVESNLEKRKPVEYVIPCNLSIEDGSNFMEWDCEETDL